MRRPSGWLKLAVLGLFLEAGPAWCGEGTTGAEFLNLIPGARSAALAGCYSALGEDAESAFFNPAGILGLLNPQLGISHMCWWDDITFDAVWGVQPLGESGALGFTAAYLNVPPFNSTDDPGIKAEYAWDLLAAGSYAFKPLKHLAVGGRLKYMMSDLSSSRSWGLALDMGAKYFLFNDQLLLAATLDNAGFLTAFQESRDSLPLNFGIGAACRLWPDNPHRISLGAELEVPLRGDWLGSVGAEGWLWNLLALRAGIRSADAGDWLNLGAGLRWKKMHVDYALSPMGTMGLAHRFSASYDFGSQRRLARPALKVRILTKQFVYPDGEAGREVRFISSVQAAAGISRWELVISDRANRNVRRFEGQDKLPLTIVWDGHNDQGVRAELEDYYFYHYRITDRLGYTVRSRGEILPVSITKLPRLKALPRDIFAGKVSFIPKSFEQVREWSLTIVSNDGRTLRNYAGVGNIPKDLAWDGRNEQQYQVAIKEGFHFVLNVKDKQGNEVQSVAPLVVVDTGTKSWTDTGLPLGEKIPFKFTLPAKVKIQGWALNIIDAGSGEVIRTFDGSGRLSQTLVWDSRDEKGRLVPTNRKYNYVLRLQDPLGNVWQQASVLPATDVRILSETPEAIKLKIEQILFDFDKAELKPAMFEKLRKTADLVKMYPPEKVKIFIEGHTDRIGSREYNLELSLKRAKMVMRYLVEEEGLQSSLIRMEGYGKRRLLKRGGSYHSRAENRRVEITITLPR